MSNQQERIMIHLIFRGSITPAEAYENYGIMKLSTRIGELIRKGVKIRKELVTDTNRFGETVRYMKYHYVGDDKI